MRDKYTEVRAEDDTDEDYQRRCKLMEAALDDGCCHRTRLAGAGCPMGRVCPYVELRAHRSFTTKWSEEDGAFVGLCDQFPNLSWLDADEGKALAGIMGLVAWVDGE